jgi:thymidine kinase
MNPVVRPGSGWVEVITGSMFSGKSEELIRRIRRAQIGRQKVQIFKPRIDDRYAADHIVSHSDMKMPSQVVRTAAEILEMLDPATEVVGIDEGQFFDAGLVQVVNGLADRGVRVIVAGLDQDYLGKPFEPMPQLLAIAEYITKTRAICMVCGNPANHTQRLVQSTDRVLIGATGTYEARCRHCFDPTLAGTPASELDAAAGPLSARTPAGHAAAAAATPVRAPARAQATRAKRP